MRWARSLGGAGLVVAGLLASSPAVAQSSASTILQVSANVLSKNNCRFTDTAPALLDFGAINPTSGTNATASVAWEFRCGGSDALVTYQLTAGNGANFSGGTRRMRIGTTASYLPYSLSITPSSGNAAKNAFVPFTISGTVLVGDFLVALAGIYSDTVTITLLP